MSELDLKKLREVAEKETPGPWEWSERNRLVLYAAQANLPRTIAMMDKSAAWLTLADDSTFIATFNPATALQLLERAEKAERLLARALNVLESSSDATFRREVAADIRVELGGAK